MNRLLLGTAISAALWIVPQVSVAQNAQPPTPQTISLSQLPALIHLIGAMPDEVYHSLGRPAASSVQSNCCRIGEYSGSVLIHVYDVDGGGIVAIVYGEYIQGIKAAGIVFDNLHALRFLTLNDFFPSGVPRTNRNETCLAEDGFHVLRGDRTSNFGANLTETAMWTAPHGAVFFTRYRTDGKVESVYDPVSTKMLNRPIANIDSLRLLQWGYFVAPVHIADLHFYQSSNQPETEFNAPSGSSCIR